MPAAQTALVADGFSYSPSLAGVFLSFSFGLRLLRPGQTFFRPSAVLMGSGLGHS